MHITQSELEAKGITQHKDGPHVLKKDSVHRKDNNSKLVCTKLVSKTCKVKLTTYTDELIINIINNMKNEKGILLKMLQRLRMIIRTL